MDSLVSLSKGERAAMAFVFAVVAIAAIGCIAAAIVIGEKLVRSFPW